MGQGLVGAQAGEEVVHDNIVNPTVKRVVTQAVKQAVKEAAQNSEKGLGFSWVSGRRIRTRNKL